MWCGEVVGKERVAGAVGETLIETWERGGRRLFGNRMRCGYGIGVDGGHELKILYRGGMNYEVRR